MLTVRVFGRLRCQDDVRVLSRAVLEMARLAFGVRRFLVQQYSTWDAVPSARLKNTETHCNESFRAVSVVPNE